MAYFHTSVKCQPVCMWFSTTMSRTASSTRQTVAVPNTAIQLDAKLKGKSNFLSRGLTLRTTRSELVAN
jgi:hypothetical protein